MESLTQVVSSNVKCVQFLGNFPIHSKVTVWFFTKARVCVSPVKLYKHEIEII